MLLPWPGSCKTNASAVCDAGDGCVVVVVAVFFFKHVQFVCVFSTHREKYSGPLFFISFASPILSALLCMFI